MNHLYIHSSTQLLRWLGPVVNMQGWDFRIFRFCSLLCHRFSEFDFGYGCSGPNPKVPKLIPNVTLLKSEEVSVSQFLACLHLNHDLVIGKGDDNALLLP